LVSKHTHHNKLENRKTSGKFNYLGLIIEAIFRVHWKATNTSMIINMNSCYPGHLKAGLKYVIDRQHFTISCTNNELNTI
jgi:hypothetical protein